ncbi:MAG: energy transducer TonB [Flavobacteriaceae bacterium]
MEPKKNPKANVSRNSSLYFALGLALMLFLTNYAINHKTYDKQEIEIAQLDMEAEIEEEIPLTQQLATPPPPPPPPPAAVEQIEVIEDEEEIEETVIESTEVDQETEIVEVEHVEVAAAVEEDVEVPFAVIENVPVFPGCEKDKDKKACMSKKIQDFVGKKFNTELASDLGLTGRQRISVMFKIDKNGDVVAIQARAPHPGLEKEAARVVGMLPKMQPGKQRGKAVTVPYALPIVFQVQD